MCVWADFVDDVFMCVCVFCRVSGVFPVKLVHQEEKVLLAGWDYLENKETWDLKDNQWALGLKSPKTSACSVMKVTKLSILSVCQGDAGEQGFPGVFGLFGPKVREPIKFQKLQ